MERVVIRRAAHGPETWARAQREYAAGDTAPRICRRYGIKEATFRQRAEREGWTKKAMALAADADLPPLAPPLAAPANDPHDGAEDPLVIVLSALRQARAAQAQGRSAEAQAHIKAGLAVAELAEVARGLKAARGG